MTWDPTPMRRFRGLRGNGAHKSELFGLKSLIIGGDKMKFCFVSEVFPYRKGEKLVILGEAGVGWRESR